MVAHALSFITWEVEIGDCKSKVLDLEIPGLYLLLQTSQGYTVRLLSQRQRKLWVGKGTLKALLEIFRTVSLNTFSEVAGCKVHTQTSVAHFETIRKQAGEDSRAAVPLRRSTNHPHPGKNPTKEARDLCNGNFRIPEEEDVGRR